MPDEATLVETAVPGIDSDPDVTSPDVPETPDGGEPQPGAEPDAGQQPDETSPDGRVIPQQWRETFKNDPKLRGIFFSEREFRTILPGGPKQARELVEKWESFGGEEAIQRFEEERGNWEALDSQFSSGDPKFVEAIAEENPDAFGKLVPTALDKLSQLDPPAYQHIMARVIVNTIGSRNSPLAKIYDALAADEKTKALAQELSSWYGAIEDLATKQPEKKIDPERKKLDEEKAEFETRKQQEFRQTVASENREANGRRIETMLGKEFSKVGRNLAQERKTDPEAYDRLADNCNQAIGKLIAADAAFNQQFEAIMATGDRARAVRFAQAKLDKVAPEAIHKTFQSFYKFFARPTMRPRPQNGNRQPQAAGTIPLGRQPKEGEIDWARTTPDMTISGKAYLKGRKELVTF